MRWLRSIAAAAISLSLVAVSDQAGAEGGDAGTTAGNSVVGRFGNKESLRKNIAVPMTDSNTQMQTIDGSKSFTAAMGAPSSINFLEVLIQPSGSGDLSTVVVGQDLDADGVFDHTFAVGSPVSGICANGFISCSPGTWNACQPYKWQSDDDGRLTFTPVGITMLAGCYCINSSCGSSLAWTNSAIVLKDLGGGAVGAIHAKDATTVITGVSTDEIRILYSGMLVRKAESGKEKVAALSAIPSAPTQQSYYGNWASLESAKAGIPMSQSGDTSGIYYQVTDFYSNKNLSSNKCSVKRDVVITTEKEVIPQAWALAVATAWPAVLLQTHGIMYSIGYNPADRFSELNVPSSGTYTIYGAADNWGKMIVRNGGGEVCSLVAPSYTSYSSVNCELLVGKYDVYLEHVEYHVGTASGVYFSVRRQGEGGGEIWNTLDNICPEGYQFIPGSCQRNKPLYSEGIANTCTSFETNGDCQLQDETIDGVMTAIGYGATGLKPLPSCVVVDPLNNESVCRDWWEKKRTYTCKSSTEFDFANMTKRFDGVVRNTVQSDGALKYGDQRLGEDGNWVEASESIALPGITNDLPDCEPACRIKRPKQENQVGTLGAVARLRNTTDSFDTYYLNCNSNVCPVEPGDIVEQDCGCLNQFSEAASVMATMRMSGADNICTTGIPKK